MNPLPESRDRTDSALARSRLSAVVDVFGRCEHGPDGPERPVGPSRDVGQDPEGARVRERQAFELVALELATGTIASTRTDALQATIA